MKNDTKNVQVHVDYVLIILIEYVKEIFRASKHTEQTLLHTAEGTITITISEADTNTVRVPVTGIIFIPISIEYTEFPTVVAKG
jgi:hypothetical protein